MAAVCLAAAALLQVDGPVSAHASHGLKPAYPRRADGATRVSQRWRLPPFEVPAEPPATETLVDALDAAYRTAPALQAQRYELRAADEDYAVALSETRPTTQIQVTGGYTRTDPGRITESQRSFVDQLTSSNITSNNVSAVLSVDQPLYTGGRAAADRDVAEHEVATGRAQLRGSEGDVLLQVITAYADTRRDARVLDLRAASVRQLEGTLAEVKARREAGELTRTDVAQAETQLDLARTQLNSAAQQLEQSRASYVLVVGHDPGVLAPEPGLPGFPNSIDHAFTIAARRNPDLAQALETERTSRSRIAAAAAQGRPQLSLRGSATVSNQVVPFYGYNADHGYAGQAVLTVPLTNGGRVGALVAQARDRNSADRLRIEGARRQMVQAIVGAWNAVATSERNVEVGAAQIAAARVLDEGTFEEYRAGLRSTFDVLFAQGSLRDAEIALVASRHDLYVAQAALLRQMGLLEAAPLLTGTRLYDPANNFRRASRRAALPWDGPVRAIDRVAAPGSRQLGIEQPPLPSKAQMAPTTPLPDIQPTGHSPNLPVPGTVGAPQSAGSAARQ